MNRSGQHAAFQPQLTDALNRQAERIASALKEEKAARLAARSAPPVIDLKRPAPDGSQPESSSAAVKRARVRSPSPPKMKTEEVVSGPGSGDCKGVEFDVSTLDAAVVKELLMAALAAVDPNTLAAACEVRKQ